MTDKRDLVGILRDAVRGYDDWPTQNTSADVINASRSLIQAIDMRAEVIANMRHHVTPTDEAIAQILGQEP